MGPKTFSAVLETSDSPGIRINSQRGPYRSQGRDENFVCVAKFTQPPQLAEVKASRHNLAKHSGRRGRQGLDAAA